ncbi:hypothetical protein [Sphingomonas alpina]|uniref:Uncharacterized protein n=1 Tax=Sphingomonas alpina TaxID=653931 RepID=A0A7H0LDE0_9SPHN|nr:hypothetical protein [Sphingomonas alpina]QNQ07693.1 hypothetical protein H3Z74_12775 [Sphingomonas alpina]
MKFSRVTAAILMASLSSPLIAASEQTVGKLTTASQGTFVAREGKLIAAYPGQSLYTGDRVLTRGKANAKVSMAGCSYTLAPTSILSVGKSACMTAPKSFAVAQDSTDAGSGEGSGSGGTIVAVLAAIAVGAGIYVAVDNNDSAPASP